jgi:hypothetical protein
MQGAHGAARRYVSRQFSRAFDKVAVPRRETLAAMKDRAAATSLSDDGLGLAARAATFRLEADTLRRRAAETNEDAIRDQYLALAQRWSIFAAHLEAELLDHIVE